MIGIKSWNSTNKDLVKNVLGMLFIKGFALILGVVSMPLYMRYFPNNIALGLWFTILTILNWVLTFDLGIGNGLRNYLTIAISKNDVIKAKELISSAYILLGIVMLTVCLCFVILSSFIDWNSFFNVGEDIISRPVLTKCINISMAGILISFFLRLITSILYALQKSALTNLISFITSLFTVAYLLIVPSSSNVEMDFTRLSIFHAFATNIPYVFATIFVFSTSPLSKSRPSILYFNKRCARVVLSLGISFLILQLLYMLISVTNEWFISKFYGPQFCVDYQIYNKLFSLIGSLYMLALTPLWSAITKALAEERYSWIIKLQKLLYWSVAGLALIQCLIIPFMPFILDLWLGEEAIDINYKTMSIFVVYSIIFTWIAVQSTLVAGLGTLKVQMWGYLIAAVIKIAGIVILSSYCLYWDIVVLVTCMALLPYCIWQPISLRKKLKTL